MRLYGREAIEDGSGCFSPSSKSSPSNKYARARVRSLQFASICSMILLMFHDFGYYGGSGFALIGMIHSCRHTTEASAVAFIILDVSHQQPKVP
jgi:hypothetical protein